MANLARPSELPCDLAQLDLPVHVLLVQVKEEEALRLACDVPSHEVVRSPCRGVAKKCGRGQMKKLDLQTKRGW